MSMSSTMMNIIITMINMNMKLSPCKSMFENKLMSTLRQFLGLVHIDRERLKTIMMRIMLIMVINILMSVMTMNMRMMKTSRTLSSLSSSVLTSSIDSPDIGSFCVRRNVILFILIVIFK